MIRGARHCLVGKEHLVKEDPGIRCEWSSTSFTGPTLSCCLASHTRTESSASSQSRRLRANTLSIEQLRALCWLLSLHVSAMPTFCAPVGACTKTPIVHLSDRCTIYWDVRTQACLRLRNLSCLQRLTSDRLTVGFGQPCTVANPRVL